METTKYLLYSFVVLLCAATVSNAEDLECYQCNPVTEACQDNKADIIKCGKVGNARCSRQIKRDSTDRTKAVRKCVIVDNQGQVSCPNGYECFNCDKSRCNADPMVVTTPTSKAAAPKIFLTALGAAVFALLRL